MEWVVIALLVVLVIVVVRSGRKRALQQVERKELADADLSAVKRTAEEDITVLGEELQALDSDLAGHELEQAARADYARALDAYESAKVSLDSVREPEEIRHVSEILEDGRYAMTCVRARVAGEPMPTRRAPCFFNPQHGPSVSDVSWRPDGGAEREVPACAADAERVREGAEPHSRQVMVGPRRVPYWQAGPSYAPYAAGYFASFGLMEMMFMGTMMGAMFGGFGGDGFDGSDGGDSGGDGGDGGGFDGGGDGGGGDFGGGDAFGDAGGGFDFGGFDF